MSAADAKKDKESGTIQRAALPAGTPAWITPELVEMTLDVWQPYCSHELTVTEAITILRNTGDLLAVLARR